MSRGCKDNGNGPSQLLCPQSGSKEYAKKASKFPLHPPNRYQSLVGINVAGSDRLVNDSAARMIHLPFILWGTILLRQIFDKISTLARDRISGLDRSIARSILYPIGRNRLRHFRSNHGRTSDNTIDVFHSRQQGVVSSPSAISRTSFLNSSSAR